MSLGNKDSRVSDISEENRISEPGKMIQKSRVRRLIFDDNDGESKPVPVPAPVPVPIKSNIDISSSGSGSGSGSGNSKVDKGDKGDKGGKDSDVGVSEYNLPHGALNPGAPLIIGHRMQTVHVQEDMVRNNETTGKFETDAHRSDFSIVSKDEKNDSPGMCSKWSMYYDASSEVGKTAYKYEKYTLPESRRKAMLSCVLPTKPYRDITLSRMRTERVVRESLEYLQQLDLYERGEYDFAQLERLAGEFLAMCRGYLFSSLLPVYDEYLNRSDNAFSTEDKKSLSTSIPVFVREYVDTIVPMIIEKSYGSGCINSTVEYSVHMICEPRENIKIKLRTDSKNNDVLWRNVSDAFYMDMGKRSTVQAGIPVDHRYDKTLNVMHSKYEQTFSQKSRDYYGDVFRSFMLKIPRSMSGEYMNIKLLNYLQLKKYVKFVCAVE